LAQHRKQAALTLDIILKEGYEKQFWDKKTKTSILRKAMLKENDLFQEVKQNSSTDQPSWHLTKIINTKLSKIQDEVSFLEEIRKLTFKD